MSEVLDSEFDQRCMRRALELAQRGEGHVEPNPMVGCVIAQSDQVVGEGWHGRYGGPHAEVEALHSAGSAARGATAYVTLEPCCHHGKTPPCTDALLDAGIERVVIAAGDPFSEVGGRGVERLRNAGLLVEVGLLEAEAIALTAPFRKLVTRGRPWVIAKWAMTLDGRIASRTGHSQWISNEASRRVVHALRGRVDAILVGSGTALADNPHLTARPPGPRTPARVVLDSRLRLPLDGILATSAREIPVLIATAASALRDQAVGEKADRLRRAGCELLMLDGAHHAERWHQLVETLGQRRMTNILVEGGGELLGSLRDLGEIDEVHAFIAPRLLGGRQAAAVMRGLGAATVDESLPLCDVHVEVLDGDLHVRGRTARP